jgi:hypothetical protein
MAKLLTLFLILSLAFISLNCKDDEESAVIPEKYVGTWEAKLSIVGTLIEYALESDPENVFFDARTLGGEIKVILKKDGAYSLTFVDPIDGPDTDSGTITLNEETKIITMNSNSDEDLIFQYEWDGDILVLTTLSEFDFTLQGNPPVPAIVTIRLKRTAS